MIAKLITTAETRSAALARMVSTLEASFLATAHSNVELIVWLAGVPQFREGAVTTHFIADQKETFSKWRQQNWDAHATDAGSVLDQLPRLVTPRASELQLDSTSLSRMAFAKSPRTSRPESLTQGLSAGQGTNQFKILTEEHLDTRLWNHATVGRITKTRSDGKVTPFWYAVARKSGTTHFWVGTAGFHFNRSVSRPTLDVTMNSSAGGLDVTAPVPGKVVQVRVAPGAEIQTGESLVVLESMKMEFEVKASTSGQVDLILVKVGDQVSAGAPLVTWKKQE
jgi:acetyl/propionyl-CoA carboxylase alpha subunit